MESVFWKDYAEDLQARVNELEEGIRAVIDERYAGDMAPLIPKLRKLLEDEDD